MNMKTIYIVVGAIFIVCLLVFLSASGYINLGGLFNIFENDPANPGNDIVDADEIIDLGLSDRELHLIISFMTNTSPPYAQHQTFINGLHMKAYGINGVTAYSVLQDYENSYSDEGFTSYTDGVKHGTGWTAYAEVWYNDVAMGRAITVGDGSAIHNAYGYDVVLITSYGPIIDYYDYVTFLSMY